MSIANIGSLADKVYLRVEGIPSYLSGAPLIDITDEARIYCEQYTGQSIGTVNIAEKYQPAIVKRACADVMDVMQTQGADVNSITVGDFTINKGKGGNLSTASESLREEADKMLKQLGRKVFTRQVIGGL